MMELTEDAVSEILLRLPVKSLVQFSCVCKNWYNQIKNPLFKENHMAFQFARDIDDCILVKWQFRGNCNELVTCYRYSESPTCWKSTYDHGTGRNMLSFLTHVNGIVCLFDSIFKEIRLFNPALGESMTVPYVPLNNLNTINSPIISRRAVGFGFDDATQEYMVVQILSIRKKKKKNPDYDTLTEHQCVVYLVKADTFTMFQMPAFVYATKYFNKEDVVGSSFFSHGSIHWCVGRGTSYRILTFNTTTRLFQEIQFPYGWKDYYKHYSLNPCLFKVDNSCIALVAESCSSKTYDVWLMKEYGVRESWTKQYSISSNGFNVIKPLSFWRKDKLFLLTPRGIVCYDLSKGELCENIDMSGRGDLHVDSLDLVTCYGSFVSFKQSRRRRRRGRGKLSLD